MSEAVFYVGSNNTFTADIRTKAGVARDLVALGVSRVVLQFAGSTIDSTTYPSAIDYTTAGASGQITFDLTGFEFAAGSYGARIIIYYAAVPNGEIVADGLPIKIGEAITGIVAPTTSELAIHAAATSSVHGVTGDIVGTSDTQTLTNKIIQGASIKGDLLFNNDTANSPGVLFYDTTPGAGNSISHIEQVNEVYRMSVNYRGGTFTGIPISVNMADGVLSTLGNRVLTVADEGSGNGLDADTLDGQEGSYYAVASAVNPAILGDGTSGRVLRSMRVAVEDGTNANTVKVTVTNVWNGDSQAATDNIADGDTSGIVTMSASGVSLSINTTGTCLAVTGAWIYRSDNAGTHYLFAAPSAGDVQFQLTAAGSGTPLDWSTLMDTGGTVIFDVSYVTSA